MLLTHTLHTVFCNLSVFSLLSLLLPTGEAGAATAEAELSKLARDIERAESEREAVAAKLADKQAEEKEVMETLADKKQRVQVRDCLHVQHRCHVLTNNKNLTVCFPLADW